MADTHYCSGCGERMDIAVWPTATFHEGCPNDGMWKQLDQLPEDRSAATPLEQFIAARGDEARLALGPDVLRAAYEEARDQHLVGWQTEINEYVYALESGKGLNRPMPEPSAAQGRNAWGFMPSAGTRIDFEQGRENMPHRGAWSAATTESRRAS